VVRPRLQALESRTTPAFGFGAAVGFGGAGYDYGTGLALDGAGNVYVSGFYQGTADFDPAGTNPGSNHVLIASGDQNGYAAKYLADGTFQWATDLGPGAAIDLAVSGSSVYVPGNGPGGYVSRLDAATGAVSWTTIIAPDPNAGAADVAVGPAGEVYAWGRDGSGAGSQAVLARLDSAGNVVWTRSSTGGTSAHASRVAVDAAGNVYAQGMYAGTVTFGAKSLSSIAGSSDVFVWKLNPSGATVWAGSVGGSGTDFASGIAVDGAGYVAMTGYWSGTSTSNDFDPGSKTVRLTYRGGISDAYVVKLAPDTGGALKFAWAQSVGGTGSDSGMGVTVDGAGNIYLSGWFEGTVNFNTGSGKSQNLTSAGGNDSFVRKVDPAGKFLAAARAGGIGGDSGRGIAVDAAGNVFQTGFFSQTANFSPTGTYTLSSAAGSPDGFMLKLTQTSPQLAAGGLFAGAKATPLTAAQLGPVFAAAIDRWAAAGLPAADLARLRAASLEITDLKDGRLGAAALNGDRISIDATAAGWGWFIDSTPDDDGEYRVTAHGALVAGGGPASGRLDLLTVVMHELGHVIGLESRFDGSPNDLMTADLSAGERRLPSGQAGRSFGVSAIPFLPSHLGWLAGDDHRDDSADWFRRQSTATLPEAGA